MVGMKTQTTMPTILVRAGDVVDVDADVVVVSANTLLDFEGRAGEALADACGPQVAVELATVQARRAVKVGDIVVTKAGRHPRVKAIFWAVVRDHRPQVNVAVDDAVAVESALRALWRSLLELKRQKPLSVALVPIGAVELGAARATEIILRTLQAQPAVHARLSRVVLTTNRPLDIDDIEAAARPFRPAPAPTAAAPTAPAPTTPERRRPAPTALTPVNNRTQQEPSRDTRVDGRGDEDPTVPFKAPRPPQGWSSEATTSLKPKRPRP